MDDCQTEIEEKSENYRYRMDFPGRVAGRADTAAAPASVPMAAAVASAPP